MIVPMSMITVHGNCDAIVSVVLSLPCRPVRILTNLGRFQGGHSVYDDFLVTGITYKVQGKGDSIWGPWWPAGSTAPASLLGPEFAKQDLTFEMPMLAQGDVVEVHVNNINPCSRWFSCSLEAVPGGEAYTMAGLQAGEARWAKPPGWTGE